MKDYALAWQELAAQEPDAPTLARFCHEVANTFLDHHLQDGSYEADCIDLLCRMAASRELGALANIPAATIFELIIEHLCDDFEEWQEETYNRVMGQMVEYYRHLESQRDLDHQLSQFGISNLDDLRSRANMVQRRRPRWHPQQRPERIYLLSRVTVGADVAITSVLVQRLTARFPDAELTVLGPGKLAEVFGGLDGLRIQSLDYTRRGGIADRFGSWQRVLAILDEENQGTPFMVVDPDSRISQLGVLPVADPGSYLFFNTRTGSAGGNCAMAALANAWADHTFGRGDFCWPRVWIHPAEEAAAAATVQQLRSAGAGHLTTINFGVGGNPRKRLGLDFEFALLEQILRDPSVSVLLDKGFGAEEQQACHELLARLGAQGCATGSLHCGEPLDGSAPARARVWAVEAAIGQMGALIGQSDDFIGYDSACQHIAAAQSVPTVTIFAGTNNPRFIRRWAACGQGPTGIVHVNTLSHPGGLDHQEIVQRVIARRAAGLEAFAAAGVHG